MEAGRAMKKYWLVPALLMFSFTSVSPAEAVQVKRVQSGWVKFLKADLTKTVTLATNADGSPVDISKAFSLIMPAGGDGGTGIRDDRNYFFTSKLATSAGSTTLTLQRSESTSNVVV